MAKITREIIENADKENKSDKQIAIENGVSRQAVYQMRKKYGMTSLKIKPFQAAIVQCLVLRLLLLC